MNDRPNTGFEARVVRAGLLIAGLAVFAMMIAGASDALATFFGFPVAGALELAELLMVLVVFLSLPEAESHGRHITIDLISSRLPKSMWRALKTFGAVLSLLFYGAMTWQAWRLFGDSWAAREHTAGLVNIPVYPTKALFAIALVIVTAVATVNVLRALRGRSTSPHAQSHSKSHPKSHSKSHTEA